MDKQKQGVNIFCMFTFYFQKIEKILLYSTLIGPGYMGSFGIKWM